jgi:hypothetical protein
MRVGGTLLLAHGQISAAGTRLQAAKGRSMKPTPSSRLGPTAAASPNTSASRARRS